MNALTDFLSIVGGTTAIALLGMAVVRKKAKRESLEASHEVGGYLLAIVGTLYAILVGLIVVSAQAKLDTASQMAVTEANMLTNIYHLSKTFDQASRKKIRQDLYDYATIASTQDWAKVEEGEEPSLPIDIYGRTSPPMCPGLIMTKNATRACWTTSKSCPTPESIAW